MNWVTVLSGYGGLTMFRMLRGSQEKQKMHPIDISSRMVLLIRCMSASILERWWCWWWFSFWRAEKSSLTPLGSGLVTSVVTSAVLPQFSLFDIDGLRGLQIKKGFNRWKGPLISILRYGGLKVFCLWTRKTAFRMGSRWSDLYIKMVKNTQEIHHKAWGRL